MPVCCGGYNLGRRGPLLRAQIALVASLLILVGCGGDDDTDTGDDGDTASMAITDSNAVDTGSTAGSDAAATVVDDSTAAATTTPAPVRLGDRFEWCESVQRRWDTQVHYRSEAEAAALAREAAVGVYEAASDDLDRAEAQEALDRALADYASAASDYGKTRWGTAGLIVGDMSSLSAGYYRDDTTLQVAIERAFEAFGSNAGADTLAAFDSAHEATDTLELASSVERLGGDEPVEAVEVPESEPVVFDASEAWLMAIEALDEALEAVGDAEDAKDAAVAAAAGSRGAASEARGAASQIYSAARGDGDWEALISDFEAQLAAARSGVRAAEGFAVEAVEAAAAAEAAFEAARAAEQASAAARALASESGATEGKQAYRDMPTKAPQARIDAQLWARVAAASAGPTTREIVEAAQAAQQAAWHVARISADIDAGGVAAFRQSLQESCR